MKCTATSKSTGAQCKKEAIAGGTVCRNHGGAAPQVRNAAAKRLADAVNSAVANLLAKQESKLEAVSLRASQDILDRNNYKGENLIRIMNPDATGARPLGLNDEQAARIRGLAPDELAIFLRVLGYLKTGVRGPAENTQSIQ